MNLKKGTKIVVIRKFSNGNRDIDLIGKKGIITEKYTGVPDFYFVNMKDGSFLMWAENFEVVGAMYTIKDRLK